MKRARIAVVEDQAIVAEDIQQMLVRLGYDVVGLATTAEEALAIAQEKHPDLFLMDIQIKGPLDGIETAKQLFTQHDIPVTFITAFADQETLERAKATFPYGYIVKPFDEQELSTVVKLALYNHLIQKTLNGMRKWKSLT